MAAFLFKYSSISASISHISFRGFAKIGLRSPRIVLNRKLSSHYGCFQRQLASPQSYLRSIPKINPIHRNDFCTLLRTTGTRHQYLSSPTKCNLETLQTTKWQKTRSITIMSKLGKRKTCKAVAKRFHRTGKGKLKRWRAGKNHNMMNKSNKRRKQLKKATYVSKSQLKLLNKMLNGW